MVPKDFLDREKFYHFEITEISDHKNLPKKTTSNKLWWMIKQKFLRNKKWFRRNTLDQKENSVIAWQTFT